MKVFCTPRNHRLRFLGLGSLVGRTERTEERLTMGVSCFGSISGSHRQLALIVETQFSYQDRINKFLFFRLNLEIYSTTKRKSRLNGFVSYDPPRRLVSSPEYCFFPTRLICWAMKTFREILRRPERDEQGNSN